MIDFTQIDYLKSGNPKQQKVYELLTSHAILDNLESFSPILTGTIPIEIDIENSDLDICCCYTDKVDFIKAINLNFQHFQYFKLRETSINYEETVVANFFVDGYEIELFGQKVPVKKQNGYRHMLIEHQILVEKGADFKQKIIELKKQGFKTEPAFAQLLGLKGNPYEALLEYSF